MVYPDSRCGSEQLRIEGDTADDRHAAVHVDFNGLHARHWARASRTRGAVVASHAGNRQFHRLQARLAGKGPLAVVLAVFAMFVVGIVVVVMRFGTLGSPLPPCDEIRVYQHGQQSDRPEIGQPAAVGHFMLVSGHVRRGRIK